MNPSHWRRDWIHGGHDDKWTIHHERSDTMQTPPQSDLETLAVRLGCPSALVDAGIVLRHTDTGGWFLIAGERSRLDGRRFAGIDCSWSTQAMNVPRNDIAAAFWFLWDSVGDLNPETKQAAREAMVARKRSAPPEDDPDIDYKRKFERLREVFTKHHPPWSVCSRADAEIARIAGFATTPTRDGMWVIHDGPEVRRP